MAASLIAALERINVIGTSGSGKTTFARELACLLGLPYHEMDALFWKPGWRESSDEELFAKWKTRRRGTRAISWRRVQAVIWLDPSFATTLWSVTARMVRRALTREELWPGTGNRESLGQAFFTRKSNAIGAGVRARPIRRYCASTRLASFCGFARSSSLGPE